MNERMSRPESRALYARRKTIVEPVFGQIKNSGFRGFGLRGKEKVAGEFSLVCVAHNLKKIMLAALRGEVCPEFGKRAAWEPAPQKLIYCESGRIGPYFLDFSANRTTMHLKIEKIWPRFPTFSLRSFLPRRLLGVKKGRIRADEVKNRPL